MNLTTEIMRDKELLSSLKVLYKVILSVIVIVNIRTYDKT